MESVRTLKSDITYIKQLAGAGWDGIAAARREWNGGVFPSPRQTAVWTPAAVGATIGILSPRLLGSRKSASSMAMGGLVGSILGLGAALVWGSRRFTGPAARRAVRRVSAVRDAHWLESNPITYA